MVKEIVSKVVKSIISKPELDLEIERDKIAISLQDQGRQPSNEEIDKEQSKRAKILVRYVTTITKKFYEKTNQFPSELCDFVKIMKFNFQSNPSIFYQLIGGWFFLRCLVPVIVAPEKTVLTKSQSKTISRKSRRNLILVGKILQGIANDSLFDSKDDYSETFKYANKMIQQSIHKSIDKISQGKIMYKREMECDPKRIQKIGGFKQINKKLKEIFASNINYIEEQSNTIQEKYECSISIDKIKNEIQELKQIISNNDENDLLNEENYAERWNVIARRRTSHQNSLDTFEQINEFIVSPRSRDLSDSFDETSNNLTISSDDSFTSNEISTCESSDFSKSDELFSDELIKLMKVKYRSKIINLPAVSDLKEVTSKISLKFGLKKQFFLCHTLDEKEIVIKNALQWENYLNNNYTKTSDKLLYRLHVKVK